jgi:hypothetical protein
MEVAYVLATDVAHSPILYEGAAMTLEQLVPSLSLCQQLKAAGFPQDTALVWMTVEIGEHNPMPPVVTQNPHMKSMYPIVAAPTAGELEEWLITVFGFREILTNFNPCDPRSERRWMVLGSLHPEETVQHTYGSTHLAALAALVLEVAR